MPIDARVRLVGLSGSAEIRRDGKLNAIVRIDSLRRSTDPLHLQGTNRKKAERNRTGHARQRWQAMTEQNRELSSLAQEAAADNL